MIFDDFSYLVHGDSMPEVRFTDIEGGQIYPLEKGKILLLDFFIIPCKHCKHMLEYLQEEIWPNFQDGGKLLLAVGRGHNPKEVREFRDKGNYILPFAADPDRANYDKFAERKVPRNYLFDANGTLVYQTRGYDLDQMSTLRVVLQGLEEE